MTLIKRSLTGVALTLLAGLIVLAIVFWTPDTSFEEMKLKYANGESQFIDLLNGDRIHYRDQGDVSKTALVLIHGTSASLHTWEPLIENLGDGYRFISLDLPGHGLTGENADSNYSRQAMVNSIWQVLDHLEIESASLIGNSLGGAIAWASAIDRPEKVKALILLAPSGAPSETVSQSNIGFKILKTSIGQALMKKIMPRSIIKASLVQTVVAPEIVTEKMVDRYWELLRMQGNRQAMIDLANTPRDKHAWKKLSSISAPTLVIWGEQDGVLPVTMKVTFDSEIENAKVQVLEDIGHLPMEEAVDQVSALILEFCSSIDC
ncbi:MAG: pimeloyl-ACP methyl ester carboxylesterase [Arenicella sp.]|jgi:pimeloyl-ACP methyl ester carboxylesterase